MGLRATLRVFGAQDYDNEIEATFVVEFEGDGAWEAARLFAQKVRGRFVTPPIYMTPVGEAVVEGNKVWVAALFSRNVSDPYAGVKELVRSVLEEVVEALLMGRRTAVEFELTDGHPAVRVVEGVV